MIAVFIEIRDGKVKKSSLEAVSAASRAGQALGGGAAAVLAGPGAAEAAAETFKAGAAKAFVLESPDLAAYSTQGYAYALAKFVEEHKPAAVFFSATAMGKDLAPRLAARLGVGMASDCAGVEVKDGALEFTRPVFAGKAVLALRLKTSPAVATLRPNMFPVRGDGAAAGEVATVPVEIPQGFVKARVEEVLRDAGAEMDVSEADIVVSGGRGMKGPENFALLRDLAAILPKAAVGASRSAVDSGWIGHQHQVGQTGKTVSPNLYIAFGISGAIQHLAGMSSSKRIVAVNKDPEAPIFKVADFGIVGDLFEVIPKLQDELKKILAE